MASFSHTRETYDSFDDFQSDIKRLENEMTFIVNNKMTVSQIRIEKLSKKVKEHLRFLNNKNCSNEDFTEGEFQLWSLCESYNGDLYIINKEREEEQEILLQEENEKNNIQNFKNIFYR